MAACGANVRIIACIEDSPVIQRILYHLEQHAAQPTVDRALASLPLRSPLGRQRPNRRSAAQLEITSAVPS